MKSTFKCRQCNTIGDSGCSTELAFMHCGWYMDYKGLHHGCLYCRKCGAVYDTIGTYLAPIKMILNKMPSKIIAEFDFESFQILSRINNPDCPTLHTMNPFILEVMESDGRINPYENFDNQVTDEYLIGCLNHHNFFVRKEAVIGLGNVGNLSDKALEAVINSLNDNHWDVRRYAAIILGDIGDSRAVEPLKEVLQKEKREYYVIKATKEALAKLSKK